MSGKGREDKAEENNRNLLKPNLLQLKISHSEGAISFKDDPSSGKFYLENKGSGNKLGNTNHSTKKTLENEEFQRRTELEST